MVRLNAILFAALIWSGCAGLKVTKLDSSNEGTAKGVRVALPVPGFLVTPTGDGGVEVAHRDMPDPTNTFAIDGWSILSRHVLDVTVTNGLLEEIHWNPDTTAALKQAATSAAAVGSEALKADLTATRTSAESIRVAKLEVAQAEEQAKLAEELGDAKAIYEAKVVLAKAKLKLASLLGQAETSGIYNDPTEQPGASANSASTVPGPMLFVLDEHEEGGKLKVRLVPLAAQREYAVGGAAKVKAVTKISPKEPEPIIIPRPPVGELQRDVELTQSIAKVSDLYLEALADLSNQTPAIVRVRPKSGASDVLEIALRSSLKAGEYRLSVKIDYIDPQGKTVEDTPLAIELKVE